jgi:hypothetical protein
MSKARESKHKERIRYMQGLPVNNANAAGIDIGDSQHDVAIRAKDGSFITNRYKRRDVRESLCFMLKSDKPTHPRLITFV